MLTLLKADLSQDIKVGAPLRALLTQKRRFVFFDLVNLVNVVNFVNEMFH